MKYNKSEIMKKAWNIFRSTKKTFSESLKEAWKKAKEIVKRMTEKRYMIPDWFMNRNYEKVTTAHCKCYQTFGKEDIKKETEKAFFVELGMMTKSGHDTNYSKKIWVPKSIVEEYEI